jgi:hypothetical protein
MRLAMTDLYEEARVAFGAWVAELEDSWAMTTDAAFFAGYVAGYTAALEAQHTRDEEARAIVTRLATLRAWWQKTSVDQLIARARAYVEQSDQGKGETKA